MSRAEATSNLYIYTRIELVRLGQIGISFHKQTLLVSRSGFPAPACCYLASWYTGRHIMMRRHAQTMLSETFFFLLAGMIYRAVWIAVNLFTLSWPAFPLFY